MKIGELAKNAGLRASAIRYYEKLGIISAPDRKGNQRRYAGDALNRLLLHPLRRRHGLYLGGD